MGCVKACICSRATKEANLAGRLSERNRHMRAARFRQWLEAKDPGHVAVKRAARVTLAACLAFYFSLYVLDDTQMATFASFGCIAFGARPRSPEQPVSRRRDRDPLPQASRAHAW